MKKNRYLIFAAALAVFLFCMGCGNVTRKVKSFVGIDAFNIHQVITKDSATSRTIMWQSNTEEKDAYVEYRKNKMGAATQMQKERINDKFTGDGKTTWVHTVTLNNLEPGAEYEYLLGPLHRDGPCRGISSRTRKNLRKRLTR